MMLLRLSREGKHPAAMRPVHSMLHASHQWPKHVLRPAVGLGAVPASVLHALHFTGTAHCVWQPLFLQEARVQHAGFQSWVKFARAPYASDNNDNMLLLQDFILIQKRGRGKPVLDLAHGFASS